MEALPLLIRGLGSEELSAQQPDLGEFGRKLFTQLLELTSAEDTFDSALRRCKEKTKSFTDENFPPSQTSLLFPITAKENAAKWTGYIWKRINELPEYSKPAIFQGNSTILNQL